MAGGTPPGAQPQPSSVTYSNLVSSTLAYRGIDQGIDFVGSGDLFAPAKILITRVEYSGSGWPGQGAVVAGKLLDGPRRGQYVYYSEDLVPTVQRGKVYPAGHTVAKATGSGQAPGVEIGWAQANGSPLAPRPAPRPAPQYTKEGQDFHDFVQGGSGARPGHTVSGDAGAAAKSIPVVGQAIQVGDFLGRLTDPSYLLRGLQLVAGAVLVLTGVVLLTRQVALAADLPDPLRAIGSKGASVVSGATTKSTSAPDAAAVA